MLVFDHAYHFFSLAYHLLGPVEKVCTWIDRSAVGGLIPRRVAEVDAPAPITFKFKAPQRYGILDFVHTHEMDSIYYADDDRVEVIGEKGIIFINRCTARKVDLPAVMLFKDGDTEPVPVERVEWHDSFIDYTRHLVKILEECGGSDLRWSNREVSPAVCTSAAGLSSRIPRSLPRFGLLSSYPNKAFGKIYLR